MGMLTGIRIIITAIGFYDAFLTLSREIAYIWTQKFNTVSILYLWQRFCVLLIAVVRFPNPTTLLVCLFQCL